MQNVRRIAGLGCELIKGLKRVVWSDSRLPNGELGYGALRFIGS
jgi:hypothetical protein